MTRTPTTLLAAIKGIIGLALATSVAGCASSVSESPALAFGVSASDLESACALDGASRIVAAQVDPTAGIAVVADGDVLSLRFATTLDPSGLAVSIDPQTLRISNIKVRHGEPAAAAAPIELVLPNHERLVAWTSGARGTQATSPTLSDAGSSLNNRNNLGFQGRAVGRPAVAFSSKGEGVLAFIESTPNGFQVVAVHARCTAN
jgi:hypothetical protein